MLRQKISNITNSVKGIFTGGAKDNASQKLDVFKGGCADAGARSATWCCRVFDMQPPRTSFPPGSHMQRAWVSQILRYLSGSTMLRISIAACFIILSRELASGYCYVPSMLPTANPIGLVCAAPH